MQTYDEGRKVCNRRHDTLDHSPSKSGTRSFTRLMDDWSEPVGFSYGPDEKGKTSSRNEIRFDSEQMADLVDGKPDCWERAKPEEKKGDVVPGISALVRERVWEVFVGSPN